MAIQEQPEHSYSPTPHLLAFVDALGFSKVVTRGPSSLMDEYLRIVEVSRSGWHNPDDATDYVKIITIGDAAVFAIECEGSLSDDVLVPTDRQGFLFDL